MEDRLRISAPKHVTTKQLKELLRTKQEWILTHWQEKQNKLKCPVRYVTGEPFLYRGKTVELKIIRQPQKMMRVLLESQVLKVYIPHDLRDEDWVPSIRSVLLSWYKAQARRVLQDKLDNHAKRMQVTFHTFRLKDQKTRWGSCSSKGNLNFNWRIIMAPDPAIDYIIIHELAHLTHLNHSEQFWKKVEEYMPDFKQWRNWFKEHGQELRVR